MSANESELTNNTATDNKRCLEDVNSSAAKRNCIDQVETENKNASGDMTRTILMGGGEGMRQLEEYLSNKTRAPALHSQYIHKPSTSSNSSSNSVQPSLPNAKKKWEDDISTDYYFKGYSNINIHRDMIADHVRTMTYRRAILRNFEVFRGKVVADVGAGTGILSVFCSQAGAKKVYAIEASHIAEQAKLVVAENNLTDKIEVIHAKVEDVDLPEKVDIIVSEWMGYCLLYESMLTTVLVARDKWLKPGGSMFPSSASIFLAPYSDPEDYDADILFWDSVSTMYKVNMTSLKPYAQKCLTQCPHVKPIDVEDIMASGERICQLDLLTTRPEDLLKVTGSFNFSCYGHSRLRGFLSWFTVTFPGDIELSTSPYKESTHWAQTVFYVNNQQNVEQDSKIVGKITLRPSNLHTRFLEVDVGYQIDDTSPCQQHYIMDDMSA